MHISVLLCYVGAADGSDAGVCLALDVHGQRQSFYSDSVAGEGRTEPGLAKPFQSVAVISRGCFS